MIARLLCTKPKLLTRTLAGMAPLVISGIFINKRVVSEDVLYLKLL